MDDRLLREAMASRGNIVVSNSQEPMENKVEKVLSILHSRIESERDHKPVIEI